MAQQENLMDREKFCCSICLDLLKDPVTVHCGHSYCRKCIETHWDEEDTKKIYSCPQCRKTFTPRPVLEKNTMLADLMEELKKTGLQAAPADHCYAGPEDVACDFCTGRKLKACKSCLVCLVSYCEKHLQPHYDVAPLKKHKLVDPSKNLDRRVETVLQRLQDTEEDVKLLQQEVKNISQSADKTVEDTEKIQTELIRLIQERFSDVRQQVRSKQEAEVSRVKELQEKLEQEITELKRKVAELKQLSLTEDHNQFLRSYPSLSALSESTHSSSINIRPLRHFEDVTAAVSELRDKLQDCLRQTGTNVSLPVNEVPQPESQTRAEFLKYSREITLDPNTVNTHLLLSEGNKRATLMDEPQSYLYHPDRFTDCEQVLSRESLTGRCYWEVEWRGGGVVVAVAYKNISRAESGCLFGFNDKSWSLECDQDSYVFYYNNIQTPVSGPGSSRVGVYLDHRAGVLSFYSVSKTMTLLHRVQTTFTQPLHAGLWFYWLSPGTTAEICNLR